MNKLEFAHADALGRSDQSAQVFVQGFGPRGGIRGSFGVTAAEARRLAVRLTEAADKLDGDAYDQRKLLNMTWERWQALTPEKRDELRDKSRLHPKLANHVGWRVRVTPKPAHRPATFIVGQTTGWRPNLLALRSCTQHGSSDLINVDEKIDHVTLIEKVR